MENLTAVRFLYGLTSFKINVFFSQTNVYLYLYMDSHIIHLLPSILANLKNGRKSGEWGWEGLDDERVYTFDTTTNKIPSLYNIHSSFPAMPMRDNDTMR